MLIEAIVEGVSVVVDHYSVSHGKSSTSYTRITAHAEGPGDFKLRLQKEGALASIGKALGAQDVVVGDPTFDETFVFKTNDEELARVLEPEDDVVELIEVFCVTCETLKKKVSFDLRTN